MSKRNRNKLREREPLPAKIVNESPVFTASKSDTIAQHAAEYKIISKDMIRLIALNGFMLAAVLVVYYTNRSSGYLERFFEKFF